MGHPFSVKIDSWVKFTGTGTGAPNYVKSAQRRITMKTIVALVAILSFSTLQASELDQVALNTLLNSKTTLSGDVHSHETVESIYTNALRANAKINNVCVETVGSKSAKCILWLTFSPIGETALEYSVLLPGDKLLGSRVDVSRGD